MEIVDIPDPAQFDATLAKYTSGSRDKPLLLLFTGSRDASGKSWCPDCNVADPIIHKFLDPVPSTMLRCFVNRGPEARAPYRNHPKVKLGPVPTLIHWGAQGPKEKLLEGECADESLMTDFVEAISG